GTLAFAEHTAVTPPLQRLAAGLRACPRVQQCRVDVHAEPARVELRDAQRQERAQGRLERRTLALERAVEPRHAEKYPKSAPPQQRGFQHLAVLAPLVPEERSQIPAILPPRFFRDPHARSRASCRRTRGPQRVKIGRASCRERVRISAMARTRTSNQIAA